MVYIQWRGNRKVPVPIFSLPPVITCIGATESCKRICYGKKSWIYPAVRKRRMENYNDSQKPDFVDKIIAEMKKHKFDKFRIHETGDFYSQEYLDKWIEIVKAFPEVRFLAYTKSWQLDFSKIPKNLIIYYSVMPDTKHFPKTKMPYAYVIGKSLTYKSKVTGFDCPYPEKGCKECGYKCWDGGDNVIFKRH